MTLVVSRTRINKIDPLYSRLVSESRRKDREMSLTSASGGFSPLTIGQSATVDQLEAEAVAMPVAQPYDAEFEIGLEHFESAYIQLVETSTSQNGSDILMAQLAYAAEQGDEAAFVAAYRQMDWAMRSADDFQQTTQWALTAGAHGLARQLAQQGAQRYPSHEELQKYAHVLAPPRMIRRELSLRSDVRNNRDWIKQHGNDYRGKWIALRNGQLLATADSFDALADQFSDPRGVLLTKIF
jgi:hypothetical protein